MRKLILVVCLGLFIVGCQQPSQQNNVSNDRKDAAKKLFAQSMLMLQQKDIKGAVTSLEASIKIDPSDPNPYLVLGQILIKAEQFDQAAEFLDQTAKTFPDNGTVFYMLGVANKMVGKKLPAVLAARRSYELFNAAGDTGNAQSSAVLLEALIKSAQEDEKVQASTTSTKGVKTNTTVKK
ncbi:MAG: tetratricopeptide repeat protein [Candidatus Omnitrophota bacterium]